MVSPDERAELLGALHQVTGFAEGLLTLTSQLVEALEGQRERGRLEFEEAEAAIDAIIGLAIGDQQVRRLLGVLPMPETEQMEARAERAARMFLMLFGREDGNIDDTDQA